MFSQTQALPQGHGCTGHTSAGPALSSDSHSEGGCPDCYHHPDPHTHTHSIFPCTQPTQPREPQPLTGVGAFSRRKGSVFGMTHRWLRTPSPESMVGPRGWQDPGQDHPGEGPQSSPARVLQMLSLLRRHSRTGLQGTRGPSWGLEGGQQACVCVQVEVPSGGGWWAQLEAPEPSGDTTVPTEGVWESPSTEAAGWRASRRGC